MRSAFALGAWVARRRIQAWQVARSMALAIATLSIVAVLRWLSGDDGGTVGLVMATHLGLVVPLACAHWVRSVTSSQAALLADPFARTGNDRRGLAFGQVSVAWLVAASCMLPLALLAHGFDEATGGSISLWALLLATALATLGYVAAAVAVRARWPRAGLTGFLLLDWLFGSGSGALSLPWPRALLRAVAGGTPPLALSASACALLLVGICFALGGWWWRRTPA